VRTCADVLAQTLRDAGVTRIFGLPGGEMLDFLEAARRVGIRFILTRHEATAAFMADVTGQIRRQPGVCISTLGPGAINMTLGVANAYLDRSPVLAITASLARAAEPYATHQQLDLSAVYRPFTKLTVILDGEDTAAAVCNAIRVSRSLRMGPVHLALPSDVARAGDASGSATRWAAEEPDSVPPASAATIDAIGRTISESRRPIVILGLDLNPYTDAGAVREFVERLGAPTLVTPKAKGMLAETHPLFCGVCGGVAGDAVITNFLGRGDLLIGVGFEPVESDKLWHHTMPLVAIGPVSIAAGAFRPALEAVGDVRFTLATLGRRSWRPLEWEPDAPARLRDELTRVLRPVSRPRGLSPYELTRALRALLPRETIIATDVGSIKSVTTQAWTTFEPLTFFESNGLSAMGYSFPAAMAARLEYPERPVLCTIGDGGFGMAHAEIETCVRERLHFLTVVFNDSALSLIDVAQQNRGYPTHGVKYGSVNFAAVAAGLGAWAARVETTEALQAAVQEGLHANRPAVIDALVDPAEYAAHHPRSSQP
jgi:acetolactate synthase-1/2/3 large subunit